MPTNAETLKRYREARQILSSSAPPRAVWFLVGGVPCCIWKGSMGPVMFDDPRKASLVREFLAATGTQFGDLTQASVELLGNPTMKAPQSDR